MKASLLLSLIKSFPIRIHKLRRFHFTSNVYLYIYIWSTHFLWANTRRGGVEELCEADLMLMEMV